MDYLIYDHDNLITQACWFDHGFRLGNPWNIIDL